MIKDSAEQCEEAHIPLKSLLSRAAPPHPGPAQMLLHCLKQKDFSAVTDGRWVSIPNYHPQFHFHSIKLSGDHIHVPEILFGTFTNRLDAFCSLSRHRRCGWPRAPPEHSRSYFTVQWMHHNWARMQMTHRHTVKWSSNIQFQRN